MKSVYTILTLLTWALVLPSCDIQEYDVPDETALKVSIQDRLQGSLILSAYNQAALPERTASLIMQYLKVSDSISERNIGRYAIPSTYIESYWSDGLYNGALKAANELLNQSKVDGSQNMEAIAKIILALEYGNATLSFGDIPFTEALQAEQGILTPTYSTQEDVYEGIHQMLTEAIEILPDNIDSELATVDLFANGDMRKWKYLANGLLARYSLQITKRDASGYTQALGYLAQSFPTLEDQVVYNFGSGIDHPLYVFGEERPSTYSVDVGFAEKLEEKNDPRRSLYFEYDPNFRIERFENKFWAQRNSFVPIVSYVELQFIKAECELMTGASDEAVSATLAKAIESSMEQMGIDGTSYALQNSYISVFSSTEEKLEHIINQAYFAYFGYGGRQSWNNYRRLGYPELILTGTPSENNPTGALCKRFPYPDGNPNNTINLQAAKDNQNGAQLDDAIWLYNN